MRRACPSWAADDDQLEATQTDADAAAKRFWQRSSWYRRASIRNESLAGQMVIDDLSTQGAVFTDSVAEAAVAGDLMARRRVEDERFAYFAEAAIVFLDLPDAVFRGYHDDDQLLGQPSPDDEPPFDVLRREIERLEPQRVYFPLGIGGHVDHQLSRTVGMQLLGLNRDWVMPGPDYAGSVVFYEDFPYAWWEDFRRVEDLAPEVLANLPPDVALAPQYADVTDQIEKKITGITIYESQLERLFDGPREMADAVRSHAKIVGEMGGIDGLAERYWVAERI